MIILSLLPTFKLKGPALWTLSEVDLHQPRRLVNLLNVHPRHFQFRKKPGSQSRFAAPRPARQVNSSDLPFHEMILRQ